MEADDLRPQDTAFDPTATSAADERLADRLEAVDAERVLQRALELESNSIHAPHTISTEQLERIAAEIGVDPLFVHQALGEVRLEPAERSRFARFVLPEDLMESVRLEGLDRTEAEAAVERWLTQREGMVKSGLLGNGIEWDVDRRWRARVLSRSLSGGNRISRLAGGDLSHRIHSMSDHDHMVALNSTGRRPLLLARSTMVLGTSLAAFLLLGAILSGAILAGLGVFALITAASIGAGIAGARAWARGVRGALRRSLTGIVGSTKKSIGAGLLDRFRSRMSRAKDQDIQDRDIQDRDGPETV